MKKIFFLLLCGIISAASAAQTNPPTQAEIDKMKKVAQKQSCEDSLLLIKGKWRFEKPTGIYYSDVSFPKTQYKQVDERLMKLASLVQAANAEAAGIQPYAWFNHYANSSYTKEGPMPYACNAYHYEYFCVWTTNKDVKDKRLIADETGNWTIILANEFGYFAERHDWRVDGKKKAFFLFGKKSGEHNGYTVFTPPRPGRPSKAVLIQRDNSRLYIPVTRQEYLEVLIDTLKKEKKIMQAKMGDRETFILESIKRNNSTADIEEIRRLTIPADQKAKSIKLMEETKVKMKIKLEQELQQVRQSRTKDSIRIEEDYDKKIKMHDDHLKSFSEKEKNEPVFIRNLEITGQGSAKFITEEEGGRMLVKFNTDYYKKELPRYVPQFFVVLWMFYENPNPPSKLYKENFESRFSFGDLKKLLDK